MCCESNELASKLEACFTAGFKHEAESYVFETVQPLTGLTITPPRCVITLRQLLAALS